MNGIENGTLERRRVYIFRIVEAEELEDWMNEQASQGYVMRQMWMVSRSTDNPVFSVVMVLPDV